MIVAELRALGIEDDGSLTLESTGTVLAARAREAERRAPGAPADAVLWEELESRTSTGAQLFLTDSLVLIIGTMVVGPEFGPLAGLAVAFVQRGHGHGHGRG